MKPTSNINKSQSFRIIEKPITEPVQKIMQTFQMENQKANTRTNLQKERHKKQSENSIILPIRALKFKPKTKEFSIVQIFENRKFICLTLKASVYQQPIASKQKSRQRLNVSFTVHHQNTIMCIPFLQRTIYTHPILQLVA